MPTDKESQDVEDFNSARFEDERADRDDLRARLESSGVVAEMHADFDDEVNTALPLADELEQLFPGRDVDELLGTMRQLERTIEADRINGSRAVEEWCARNLGSFADPDKSTQRGPYGLLQTKLRSGEVVHAAEGTIRHELAKAAVQTGNADRLRAFKKQLGGYSLPAYMKEVIGFAKEARKNPAFAGSKLAAMKGAPITEQQAREQLQQQEAFFKVAAAKTAEIDALMETAEFKPLDGRQKEIEALLQSGAVVATGDTRKDLRNVAHALELQDGMAYMRKNPKQYPQLREFLPKIVEVLEQSAKQGTPIDATSAYAAVQVIRRRESDRKKHRAEDPTLRDDIRRAGKGRL